MGRRYEFILTEARLFVTDIESAINAVVTPWRKSAFACAVIAGVYGTGVLIITFLSKDTALSGDAYIIKGASIAIVTF
jgi:hypothetical protein